MARLFTAARCVATPGALELLRKCKTEPGVLLSRHYAGDWGWVPAEDRAANEEALRSGARIMSVFIMGEDKRVWCITDALGDDGKRASTCLLLPEEY